MADLQVTNTLPYPVTVYDSFDAEEDDKKGADSSYYGHLTKLGTVAARSSASLPLRHQYVDTLIAFDAENVPVARYAWNALDTDAPPPFAIGEADLATIRKSMKFVDAIVSDPEGAMAKAFRVARDKDVDEVERFFQNIPEFSTCTFASYMLALTYRAQTPKTRKLPPEEKAYSLASLIKSISGRDYPEAIPDIEFSDFSCKFQNAMLRFGGTIKLDTLKYKSDQTARTILSLFPVHQVKVDILFSVQVGLNLFGTQISFIANDFHIPVGGSNSITIARPGIKLDITPLFKFVVFTASAVIPFKIFDRKFDAGISMVIDNMEAEIGATIEGDHASLQLPAVLKGVHVDEFGVGMGIMFEPPGYALGVEGKFHIGDDHRAISLDDDTFAVVCVLEGEVPVPAFISFYIPRLDLETLVDVFTDVDMKIDVPIEFEDLSFVWNANPMEPVALPDGTLSQGGYAFSGYMNIFGFKAYSDIELDLSRVNGVAALSPLNLGNLFHLTGDSKDIVVKVDAAGTIIKNNRIPRTQAEKDAIAKATTKTLVSGGGAQIHVDSGSSPYLSVSGKAGFLDLVHEEIEAQVDSHGISFELDFGSVLSSKVKCTLRDFQNFAASFTYGPDFQVPLSALGLSVGAVHIHDTINVALSLGVSSGAADFSCTGGFDFQGETLQFGPVRLDADITRIGDLLQAVEHAIVSDAGRIFQTLLGDAERWANLVKTEVVQGVQDVMGCLRDGFQKPYDEAARILHAVGFDANTIAEGLRRVYGVAGTAVAEVLKGVGYGVDGTATALKYAGYGVNEVADALRSVGYPIAEVAQQIAGVFSLAPDAVHDVLQGCGYAADEIKNAFEGLGGHFGDYMNQLLGKLNPSHW